MLGTIEELTEITSKNAFGCIAMFGLQHSLKCNITCECCYDLKMDKSKILNDSDAEKWIKECASLGIGIFTIAGDPFADWEWFKSFFIPMCHKYGTKYLLSTNGLWGNNDKIIQDVIDLKVKAITLSVDWWHQQFVPLSSIYNIISKLKDTETKLFVSSVVNEEHPEEEVCLQPYEEDITYIKFSYVNDRNLNYENVFTHDYDGNIVMHQKVVGTSINDIKINKQFQPFDSTNMNTNYRLFKKQMTLKKQSYYDNNKDKLTLYKYY